MSRRLSLVLLLALVFTVPVAALRAAEALVYLATSAPDVAVVLPPPPTLGSDEQKAELETVRRVHDSATPAQVEAARRGVEMDFFSFAPQVGAWFKPGCSPTAEAFLKRIEKETRAITYAGKTLYQRPRPYVTDPTIVPLEKENSFSYPSGHSTRGMVFALVLADLFPEHRTALLEAGRNQGFYRMIAGVHYPSDIYAGRVLAQAIVDGFHRNAKYNADLVVARAAFLKAAGIADGAAVLSPVAEPSHEATTSEPVAPHATQVAEPVHAH